MDRDPTYARLVPSLDAWHHAHAAMVRAVSRDGVRVLSDPKRLASLLDDELAGLPRERALLVRAAEVQVPAIIKGIVSHSGTERAVELAAATLFALHGRDPDGCLWASAEMARLIGYRPAADQLSITEWTGHPAGYREYGARPGSGPIEAAAPAPAPAAAPPAPPALGGLPVRSVPVEPAVEPAAAVPPAPAIPAAPAAPEPAEGNPYFPRSRSEPAGNPYFPRSKADNPYFPWSNPELDPQPSLARGSAPGWDTQAPPRPDDFEYEPRAARRPRSRNRLLRPSSIIGALASLVLIYFALAGIFLLPPYTKQKSTPPSPSASNPANQQALIGAIPASIQGSCQLNSQITNPEVVASVICRLPFASGVDLGIVYDQFGNSGAARGAFSTDLTPGRKDWGPTTALATTSSCDPGVDPSFNGMASYTRAATVTGTADSGQVACWVSKSGLPTIDWTSTHRTIDANMALLTPPGPSSMSLADEEQGLYQFWLNNAGPQ